MTKVALCMLKQSQDFHVGCVEWYVQICEGLFRDGQMFVERLQFYQEELIFSGKSIGHILFSGPNKLHKTHYRGWRNVRQGRGRCFCSSSGRMGSERMAYRVFLLLWLPARACLHFSADES